MEFKALFVGPHFSVAHSITSSAIPLHAHSEYVLGYYFHGNSPCCLGPSGRLVFHARDVSLLNPGEAHEDFSSRSEREYLSVGIKKNLFHELAAEAGWSVRDSLYFPSPRVESAVELRRLCEIMRKEVDGHEFGRGLILNSLVVEFAVYALRHFTPMISQSSGLNFDRLVSRRRIRSALDYLRENYTAEFNLSQLAAAVGLSKYYFERSFKRATGLSPHAFMMLLRVEKAKQLLAFSQKPIAEIALELGFSDQSHFTNLFKRFMRVTPHAYRLGTR